MDKLTTVQQETFDYIKNYIKENGYPPSIRDMCKDLDVSSTSTMFARLERIEKKGYIKRDELTKRAIKIVDTPAEWIYTDFHWVCSKCKKNPTRGMGYVQTESQLYNYCPYCGERMMR